MMSLIAYVSVLVEDDRMFAARRTSYRLLPLLTLRRLSIMVRSFYFFWEFAVTKRLYVGNLPYSATEADIRDLFSQSGEITGVTLITDRETGRSKGFGFVEMSTEAEAEDAIRRFNGYSMNNRNLTVNVARPREQQMNPPAGGNSRRGGYDY